MRRGVGSTCLPVGVLMRGLIDDARGRCMRRVMLPRTMGR